MSIEQDLYIDESALDVEWLEQPLLMMRYTTKLADAKKEVMEIKDKIAVERAKLDRKIRKDPDKFKLEKITEAGVLSAIASQETYKKLNTELIEAMYEVDMIKGVVDAVQHRKDALQDLVKLHGQQYFAGPKVPRDITNEVKTRRDQSNKNVNILGTRKKKSSKNGK